MEPPDTGEWGMVLGLLGFFLGLALGVAITYSAHHDEFLEELRVILRESEPWSCEEGVPPLPDSPLGKVR